MHKRVILPSDALASYLRAANAGKLAKISAQDVTAPSERRRSRLRVYRENGEHVELMFDPVGVIPKELADEIRPIEDLFRALSEDRTVTKTVQRLFRSVRRSHSGRLHPRSGEGRRGEGAGVDREGV